MTKSVQELVHEQVASKIAAGELLQEAVGEVVKILGELSGAEANAARARRAAMKAGWSESELKSLGLAARTRTRPRAATATRVSDEVTPE